MYSYVICMSLVCTRVPSICHSQYVTRMYSYVICMLLVCTRMSSVCYSYALACQLASFFFFCRTFPEYWRIRSPPQGLRVYLRVPPQGPTLGSHHRVPPQGPTLWSHPRVPHQSPTLGSYLRVLGPTFPVCLSHYKALEICYFFKVLYFF